MNPWQLQYKRDGAWHAYTMPAPAPSFAALWEALTILIAQDKQDPALRPVERRIVKKFPEAGA